MTSKIIARKQEGWIVVSILPDVCKTPVGGNPVPVPYPVIAQLPDSVKVIESVRANGHPVLVYNRSRIPQTLGDMAGKMLGLKSQTVEGNCYPKEHSGTVSAGKHRVVRERDKFWMNGV